MVDEDASQTSLAHDVRPRPQGRVEAVEDAEQLAGRPSVVSEQEADLVGLHRWPLDALRLVGDAAEGTQGMWSGDIPDAPCPTSLGRPRVEGSTSEGEPRWQRPRSRPSPTRSS